METKVLKNTDYEIVRIGTSKSGKNNAQIFNVNITLLFNSAKLLN